ncbi:beta-lactamase family protein [Purpureocillium lavendulum]|uniref:Beta-lactamase family protein n=1 Tax=Purpureocillium lavendulum TaxID=1247861 RepID=A0AB34FUW8_9HYPO|nr:beta-lactamase family protein [Purpureocillium lavendulum]
MPSVTRALPALLACAYAAAFSPCPLIGAYYPPPTITEDVAAGLSRGYRASFDSLVQRGGSDKYGDISPNTTSFAVVYFAGATNQTIFEYHHTAHNVSSAVDSDTRFPLADVTMVFTVYSWLALMGEQWDAPITKFLPELAHEQALPWKDVTVGSLAGHMSGLPRHAPDAPRGCGRPLHGIADQRPVFLPDTTPMVSYAAFQVLAAAMERSKSKGFDSLLRSSILAPLGMARSDLQESNVFPAQGYHAPHCEPAALSMVSTAGDLARAGKAILSSRLLPSAVTRRWLHANADTSNLRNGVGRPWEVYRAGANATSPILDVFTKSGARGPYASYFGLVPALDAGFAILAHDATTARDGALDLNVYADVASDALESLLGLAAKQSAVRFGGTYGADGGRLVLTQGAAPGLEVREFMLDGVDMRTAAARQLGIVPRDLDYRLYPTNVKDARNHQFVAVFQDRAAAVDMGTPTCITWQSVDAPPRHFVFELSDGTATGVVLGQTRLSRERHP